MAGDGEQFPLGLNPYDNDPGAWGPSLLTNGEVILDCLEVAGPRSVTEFGAYAGDFTRLLLLWAEPREARVTAVDPAPQPELEALARQHPGLELIRERSLDSLEHLPLADAIVLDGDHNYYTVSQELARIWEAGTRTGEFPLVLLHDVCWPHGRRDDYYDPEQIPPEYLQPMAPGGGLYPGVPGVRHGGLPYRWPAAREGGPRKGVLTALEDFLAGHPELTLAVIPSFYGLGVVWARERSYAQRLADLLEPWNRNPLLARLERNRVLHLASSQVQLRRATDAEALLARHQQLLDRMLGSRAFSVAEAFLRVRQLGKPAFSKREIRRLLGREP
jgi:hypothetical protein